MIKKNFFIIILAIISSCKTNIDKATNPKETQIIQNEIKPTPYEIIPNQEQADAINKATEQEIEEIEVQDRIYFGYNSYDLNTEAKKILDTQILWLKSDESVKVILEGHCDERGTREYNIALGEKRANSVKKYLIDNGINESRLKVVSYGKERPAFFGSSEEVLSKNRRAVTVALE